VRFLVTAGPTREPIDPVRFLSNRSSGKMGYAIADAALAGGHEVVLISGPVHLKPPHAAKLISVSTSDEMFDAVDRHVRDCDVFVMCAAVADYKPAKVSATKIKKRAANSSLDLVPARDILASFAKRDRSFFVVGFAAETNDVEENARQKLSEKNLDMIVANDVGAKHSAMESDENEVIILFRDGETKKFPRAQKKIIAHELVNIFFKCARKSFDKKNAVIT
jgi:phosphopantothenoylcysteine decarboxylase / phosphopantothenate---cysteine ligase